MDTYGLDRCQRCKARNFIYLGHSLDITYPDPEGYQCWQCGTDWEFDGGVMCIETSEEMPEGENWVRKD